MEIARVYLFPALMSAGAVWLASAEVRNFVYERAVGQGQPVRLARRLVGAALVVTVALMIHFGEVTSLPGLTQEQALARFHYWMAVLGLVAFAGCLAVWDALAGLRQLSSDLEELQRDEMSNLRDRLKETKS